MGLGGCILIYVLIQSTTLCDVQVQVGIAKIGRHSSIQKMFTLYPTSKVGLKSSLRPNLMPFLYTNCEAVVNRNDIVFKMHRLEQDAFIPPESGYKAERHLC